MKTICTVYVDAHALSIARMRKMNISHICDQALKAFVQDVTPDKSKVEEELKKSKLELDEITAKVSRLISEKRKIQESKPRVLKEVIFGADGKPIKTR